jgi:hypothetical protein
MSKIDYFVYILNGCSWCEHSRWQTEEEAFENAPDGAQIESLEISTSKILRQGSTPQQGAPDEILS